MNMTELAESPRSFAFSDGTKLVLTFAVWDRALTAKLATTGQTDDAFADEFVAAVENGWKTKTVLTKFGWVPWGDYPAEETYETMEALAQGCMYAFLRAHLLAAAIRNLAERMEIETPCVIKTLNPDGTVTDIQV